MGHNPTKIKSKHPEQAPKAAAEPKATAQSIPLLVFHPLTPSLEQALPYLFQSERLAVVILQLTTDCFQVAQRELPAICVFSVTDETVRGYLKKLFEERKIARAMQGLPKYDPCLRIVIISEEKKGMVLDRWQELGAHEVMLAPILSRPLLGKLDRHVIKALKAAEEVEQSNESKTLYKTSLTPTPQKKEPAQPKLVIHGVALGPNTFLFPHDDPAQTGGSPEKTVTSVVVLEPLLNNKHGKWVLTNTQDDDGEGCWDWVVSEGPKVPSKFRYYGHKPVFDEKEGAWVFAGRAPKLYNSKNEGASKGQNIESPDNTAFVTTKKNGLVLFKKQLDTGAMKVWHYAKEEWEKGPAKAFMREKDEHTYGRGSLAQVVDTSAKAKSTDQGAPITDGSAKGRSHWDTSHPDATPSKATKKRQEEEEDIDAALLRALKSAAKGKIE